MEIVGQRGKAETRAALMEAARALTSRDGKFSLKQLYAESGIDRAGFQRCFTSKQDLLDALVENDAQTLGAIAAVAEPVAVERRAVQNGDFAIVAAPVDQWLERRLRVFERALAALESRQDNCERQLSEARALWDEKRAAPQVDASEIHTAEPVSDVVSRQPAAEETPAAAPVCEQAAAPTDAAPDAFVADAIVEAPISEREISDFLAHARAAAQRAAQAPEPVRGFALPRWIAWMGVAAVSLAICAGLALGNASATQTASLPPSGAGVAYRAEPEDGMARLQALADSGDPRAETLLAMAYLKGQGLPGNSQAAMRWGMAAAEQGEPVAQYLIGSLLSKDDASRAFHWYQEAALRGNIKAMHNLAIAYAEGLGVAENDRLAAAWFNRAAMQGYVDSQFDLAVLFERGQGVNQNRISALKWYLIAAKGGDAPSQARAQQLQADMPAVEVARAQVLAAGFAPQARDRLANATDSSAG